MNSTHSKCGVWTVLSEKGSGKVPPQKVSSEGHTGSMRHLWPDEHSALTCDLPPIHKQAKMLQRA